MSNRPTDPDKLRDFLQRKKQATEVSRQVAEVEDEGASNDDPFGNMPAFEGVGVPPMRRPAASGSAVPSKSEKTKSRQTQAVQGNGEHADLLKEIKWIALITLFMVALVAVIQFAFACYGLNVYGRLKGWW